MVLPWIVNRLMKTPKHFFCRIKDEAYNNPGRKAWLIFLISVLAFGWVLGSALRLRALPLRDYHAEATIPDMSDQGSSSTTQQADEPSGVNQDRARQAVADGEIMALHEILTGIDRRYQGRILEVILKDREAGLYGWVYDIRLLVPGPRVLHLRVDAGTGSILMVEGDDETEKP